MVRSSVHGETVLFAVSNQRDEIQRYHFDGKFYESEELDIIAKHFPIGGKFLDIGANVGNHSLFLLTFLHASLVVPVEPNPVEVEHLITNLYLNGHEEKVDPKWLGYGVSNEKRENFGIAWGRKNLGGAQLLQGQGDIPVVPAAELLVDREFDFIKIDVELMELQVLESLLPALGEKATKLFVEVEDKNKDVFLNLVDQHGYEVVETFKRYRSNQNFMLQKKKDWHDQSSEIVKEQFHAINT